MELANSYVDKCYSEEMQEMCSGSRMHQNFVNGFFLGGGGLVSEGRDTSLKMSLFLLDNRYICAIYRQFWTLLCKKQNKKTHPIQPRPFLFHCCIAKYKLCELLREEILGQLL